MQVRLSLKHGIKNADILSNLIPSRWSRYICTCQYLDSTHRFNSCKPRANAAQKKQVVFSGVQCAWHYCWCPYQDIVCKKVWLPLKSSLKLHCRQRKDWMQSPCLLWTCESITWSHWDSRNSRPWYHLLRAELPFQKRIWKERIPSTTSSAEGNETYVASPENQLKLWPETCLHRNPLFRVLTQDIHVTDRAAFLTAAEQPAKQKCGIN